MPIKELKGIEIALCSYPEGERILIEVNDSIDSGGYKLSKKVQKYLLKLNYPIRLVGINSKSGLLIIDVFDLKANKYIDFNSLDYFIRESGLSTLAALLVGIYDPELIIELSRKFYLGQNLYVRPLFEPEGANRLIYAV